MSRVPVTITYLELCDPPTETDALPQPFEIVEATDPPVWFFFALYDAVGARYHWTDQHDAGADKVAQWLAQSDTRLFTLMNNGWPHGFFVLKGGAQTDLVYFGLVPEATGQRIGRAFLHNAVAIAGRRGAKRLTVNTCTLDHPAALPLYQAVGFVPIRKEEIYRDVS